MSQALATLQTVTDLNAIREGIANWIDCHIDEADRDDSLCAADEIIAAYIEPMRAERDGWKNRAHGYELRLGDLGRDLADAETVLAAVKEEFHNIANILAQTLPADIIINQLRSRFIQSIQTQQ